MEPFFSVIIVCLNAGEELHKTLQSVLDQTCREVQIIIKDGMSTDGSVEKLPTDARIEFVSCKDKSIYDAMNQAAAKVRGRYVLFLNCGDYLMDADVLEKVKNTIARDIEESGAAVPCIYYGDMYERKTGNVVTSNPHLNEFALYRHVPCHQSCLYDVRLIQGRTPVYEAAYKVRADYEHFLWSVYEKQARTYYLQQTICSYEGNGFSETKQNRKMSKQEHVKITKKYMSTAARCKYRTILVLTLQPLRTAIAESKHFSAVYQKLKKTLYRRT